MLSGLLIRLQQWSEEVEWPLRGALASWVPILLCCAAVEWRGTAVVSGPLPPPPQPCHLCSRPTSLPAPACSCGRAAMSQYSFPLLSDKEIAQCLDELGLQASLELLAKPTFEFVQPIYESLVTVLMGVSRWGRRVARASGFRGPDGGALAGRGAAGGFVLEQRPLTRRRPPAAARPRREELQQPVFAAIDALEFPELHDESIPAMSFLRHLGRLMAASGVRDFSVKVCPGRASSDRPIL